MVRGGVPWSGINIDHVERIEGVFGNVEVEYRSGMERRAPQPRRLACRRRRGDTREEYGEDTDRLHLEERIDRIFSKLDEYRSGNTNPEFRLETDNPGQPPKLRHATRAINRGASLLQQPRRATTAPGRDFVNRPERLHSDVGDFFRRRGGNPRRPSRRDRAVRRVRLRGGRFERPGRRPGPPPDDRPTGRPREHRPGGLLTRDPGEHATKTPRPISPASAWSSPGTQAGGRGQGRCP